MKRSVNLKKVEVVLRYIFIIMTAGVIAVSFLTTQWETLFSGLITLALFLLPTVFSKRTKIHIPTAFQIVILLFIFASMYLGELRDYFYRYAWWDSMLHSASAVMLAYIGFLLIFTLNKDKNINLKLSPFFISLFAFCFAMTVGVVWEIFEYAVDSFLGYNMQKARNLELIYGEFDTRLGLLDTMRDFIVNSIGALTVSIIGYCYSKRKMKNDNAFWKLKDQFVNENPDLFNKD